MTNAIERNQRSRSHTGWKFLAVGVGMTALSGAAAARDNVSFSISIGTPAPMYAQVHAYPYYAPPVIYAPPQVVYAPPRVVYYAAPQYGPRPRGHGDYRHWHMQHGWR